ncbi:auxin-responsive protein SAUR32 [Lolium perenne]|jgi:SAUR family protein|uniref:auxin-responsive protein SAUR32 n=1 Tax=Lolium perenne TaxID=4522 RepID=UPI0021EB4DD0|nr:auxin-responsive protein SAUR32-like [Lolium perenne]
MKQHQEEAHDHLLAEAPAPAATTTKGCATFWVCAEEEDEAPRRFAVPVTLLGHPRILELLVEAHEKYGYAHDGAIVVPCGVDRFQEAVDAARAQQRHHHHHHFRIPHLATCFRPSHIVA